MMRISMYSGIEVQASSLEQVEGAFESERAWSIKTYQRQDVLK
jgi:hypothetical protein